MTDPPVRMSPARTSLLTPEAAELLGGIRANGFPGWAPLGLEQGRATILQLKELAGPLQPIVRFEQIRLPNTEAFLYVPESSAPVPVLIYMHGGGWVLGQAAGVDSLARMLANGSGCAVLSVNYRLAPEHKYPAALDDVLSAISWVRTNAQHFGINEQRIALGGDSSGANLAAAASLFSRDRGGWRPTFQLLIYPVLDHDYETTSYLAFGDGGQSALSRTDVAWFHDQYVGRPEELDSPYVSPLRAQTLQDLPPTLLICAEVDPLVDENEANARRLEQAGVPVELAIYPGMFHGFWRMAGVLTAGRDAIAYAADRLRAVLGAEAQVSEAIR
jgi:acetyl esterase